MCIARSIRTTLVASALVLLSMTVGAAALAAPEDDPTPLDLLDDATSEVLELEQRITALEAERIAIDTRLTVLDERVAMQYVVLEQAREDLRYSRAVYGDRVVAMYKDGTTSPVLMLLEARSLRDLLARSSLLARIASLDKALWEDSAKAASEEHYQASVLSDLQAQEEELSDINEQRRRTLERSLGRQEELVALLSEEAAAYLAELRAKEAQTRQDWIDGSIPIGTEFRFVPAVVDPHFDRTYLVPDYQPVRYRSTGEEAVMVSSWYGPGFNGKNTASGQVFNQDDFTVASRSLPFGTRLALTRGDARIIVVVNDRGPFIPGRDLDLSKAAAEALGFSGVEPVHVEFVEVDDAL